jgi:phosphoenolpyruvate synthase/pyruvate phosphate dikinase
VSIVHWLGHEICHDIKAVGGKAATLSRLASRHRVPEGFVVPAGATRTAGDGLPAALALGVEQAYELLCARSGSGFTLPVAVRSSAIDEDGAVASFAGQHDTFLNIVGRDALVDAVARCIASAHSPAVIEYRQRHGLRIDEKAIAVLVQTLVRSDVSAVVFSANPVSGSREEVVVNASWGLGESIVGGTVTPDTFVVHRRSMKVLSRTVGRKTRMTVMHTEGTREVAVPRVLQDVPSLEESRVLEMAELACRLEEEMGWPADVECAVAGDRLYLLQCRPITTLSGALPATQLATYAPGAGA